LEELALIEALKNPIRSEKAFAILVETYKERLYWHIRRIVLQHDFADDVLQNTFIKVFRDLAKEENIGDFYFIYRFEFFPFPSFFNLWDNFYSSNIFRKPCKYLWGDVFFSNH
jgi:RNA polymerase sigma-70 factor (ECF subfamily)